MGTLSVLEEIRLERKRQDGLWGSQRWHDDGTWLRIFIEELGESMIERNGDRETGMRQELVQAAAVLICWIENVDRRFKNAKTPKIPAQQEAGAGGAEIL